MHHTLYNIPIMNNIENAINVLLFQEQLLTVTTKIMTSLQKQDQSVQELSSKMDKNFAGLAEKLDSYIGEQNQFRQKKSQVEQAFFSGLQSRNSNLESIFDQDKEATEQYLKSSTIMNQQIMVRIYYLYLLILLCTLKFTLIHNEHTVFSIHKCTNFNRQKIMLHCSMYA